MNSEAQLIQAMVDTYVDEPGSSSMTEAFTHILLAVRVHDIAEGTPTTKEVRFEVLRRVLGEIRGALSSSGEEPQPTRAQLLEDVEEGLKAISDVKIRDVVGYNKAFMAGVFAAKAAIKTDIIDYNKDWNEGLIQDRWELVDEVVVEVPDFTAAP